MNIDNKKACNFLKRHCFFFAGLNGNQKSIAAIKISLSHLYGVKNITVIESLLSTDIPKRDRIKIIASLMRKQLSNNLDIILHSGGAIEFTEVFKQAIIEYPDINSAIQNMRLFLISPAGFSSNKKNKVLYCQRLLRLVYTMYFSSLYKGIDSLAIVKPAKNTITRNRIYSYIRKCLNNISCEDQFTTMIQPTYNNKNALMSSTISNKVQQLDDTVSKFSISLDRNIISQWLKKRGLLLKNECKAGYAGKLSQKFSERTDRTPTWLLDGDRNLVFSILDFLKVLKHISLSGCGTLTKELAKNGASVYFLLPEYDVVYKLRDIYRIANYIGFRFPKKQIVIMQNITHAGFAIWPEILIQSIVAVSNNCTNLM